MAVSGWGKTGEWKFDIYKSLKKLNSIYSILMEWYNRELSDAELAKEALKDWINGFYLI